MTIEEYLQMRLQLAESELAVEKLSGNVPKAMAAKSAIAELRGVEAFLNDASQNSEVANDSASHNPQSESLLCPDPSCGSKSIWNWVGTNTYRCNNCGYEWKQ